MNDWEIAKQISILQTQALLSSIGEKLKERKRWKKMRSRPQLKCQTLRERQGGEREVEEREREGNRGEREEERDPFIRSNTAFYWTIGSII